MWPAGSKQTARDQRRVVFNSVSNRDWDTLVLLRLVCPKYQCVGEVKWVVNHPGLVKWVTYHSQQY